jgi:hypothetical protein
VSAGYVYLGEAAGGRIFRVGIGVAQVGDPYQMDVYTWDDRPLGDDGECMFRWLTVLVRHTTGYNLKIVPVVDGTPQLPASFSSGPPPGALLEALDRLRVWPMKRGNRLGVQVTTQQLLGPLELVDIEYGYAPIRTGR